MATNRDRDRRLENLVGEIDDLLGHLIAVSGKMSEILKQDQQEEDNDNNT